jgi:hypothetical protein
VSEKDIVGFLTWLSRGERTQKPVVGMNDIPEEEVLVISAARHNSIYVLSTKFSDHAEVVWQPQALRRHCDQELRILIRIMNRNIGLEWD